MNSDGKHVIVLGAGLAGLSVAVWLQSFGWRVTLIDRDEPGNGASYGNAGLFANYAVIPNASRSTLLSLPRAFADRDGALSVRPHYVGDMLRYGLKFLKESRPDAFAANRKHLAALLQEADSAFSETLALGQASDLIRREGCLWIYRNHKAWDNARGVDIPMRAAHDIAYDVLDAQSVLELEPALRGAKVTGGIYFPETRHLVSPSQVSQRLFGAFTAHGGHFIQDEVWDIDTSASAKPHVKTQNGTLDTDAVVVALGAMSAGLLAKMGYHLPLVSERGYHITLAPESVQLTRPVGWLEHFFYATPMRDGVRLAGTTEFSHPEAAPHRRRWAQLERWAKTLFGEQASVTSTWVGSRASTPDGLPLVGPLTRHSGVYACTGHGHLGVTLSGLTGKLLAERITTGTNQACWTHLEPARFAA